MNVEEVLLIRYTLLLLLLLLRLPPLELQLTLNN